MAYGEGGNRATGKERKRLCVCAARFRAMGGGSKEMAGLRVSVNTIPHEVVILVVGTEMDQQYDEGNICSAFFGDNSRVAPYKQRQISVQLPRPRAQEEQAQDRVGQEVARHPRLRAMGGDTPSPRFPRSRANRTRERGTSPCHRSRRSHLRAKGAAAWDRPCDLGRRGTRHTHPPFSLLLETARPTPEAARRLPLVCAQRPYANEGSARDCERCTNGSTRATCEPERAEAAAPPLCIRHRGRRTGGALSPWAVPPPPPR
ncbi:hypothetical protein EDB84DRAFT_1677991 [Lactarius hengduanensis]|nr:hypothetical protein EDB84DRAFT_1677991 [Lactarius hengduanensis]